MQLVVCMDKLLIIDDEPTILFAVGEYFSEQGWDVIISQAIESAERLLKEKKFDAVIADLRLTGVEGKEGLEIISWVREIQSDQTVVVLLTAYGSEEIERESERLGADGFFKKPQPLPDLEQHIRALMESRRGGSS